MVRNELQLPDHIELTRDTDLDAIGIDSLDWFVIMVLIEDVANTEPGAIQERRMRTLGDAYGAYMDLKASNDANS